MAARQDAKAGFAKEPSKRSVCEEPDMRSLNRIVAIEAIQGQSEVFQTTVVRRGQRQVAARLEDGMELPQEGPRLQNMLDYLKADTNVSRSGDPVCERVERQTRVSTVGLGDGGVRNVDTLGDEAQPRQVGHQFAMTASVIDDRSAPWDRSKDTGQKTTPLRGMAVVLGRCLDFPVALVEVLCLTHRSPILWLTYRRTSPCLDPRYVYIPAPMKCR